MRSVICYFILFTILANEIIAQEDVSSSVYIDTVTIETNIQEKVQSFVSTTSLSHPLNLLAGMILLQSGQSNLLSILHRGLASRHTYSIWNGASLNSSTNGVFDYALMPLLYFSNTQFYDSGTAQNYVNTSIGGNVNLSTEAKDDLQALAKIGEGQNYDVATNFVLRNKKVISKTGLEWTQHKNAYRYELNGTKGIAQNSSFKNIHLLHDTYFSISGSTDLHISAWWQNAHREIPTFLPNGILQLQADENIRIHSAMHHRSQYYVLNQSLTVLKEGFKFTTLGVNSISKVVTLQSISELTLRKNLDIKLLTKQEYASPNFFDSNQKRNETIACLERNFEVGHQNKITLQISPRLVNGKSAPFTFHTDANFRYKKATIYVKFDRNLQLPSLNDLYWPNGGDPALLSETAWQSEVSWTYHANSFHHIATKIFNYNIDNFIQWAPESNGFWRAFNRKKVWSRGVEVSYLTSLELTSKGIISVRLNYGFTRATSQKDIKNPATTGKQLPYIPEHKLTMANEWKYKIFRVGLDLMYQSERFESSDNFTSLPSFLAMNATLGIDLKEVSLSLIIENLTDTNYTLLTGFPRPLRRFEFKLLFHLMHKQ